MEIDKKKRKIIETVFMLINTDLDKPEIRTLYDLRLALLEVFGALNADLDALQNLRSGNFSREAQIGTLQKARSRLITYQTELKDFFLRMMSTVRKQKSEEAKLREENEGLPFVMPPVARTKVELKLEVHLEYQVDSRTENEFGFIEDFSFIGNQWPLGAEEKYGIRLESRCDNTEEKMLYDFVNALDGLPITRLCTCDECGKWFLHTSKRNRLFCSDRCRARKGSRESYEKKKGADRKAYEALKKASRVRAKKSYDKKVKAQLGSNVSVGKNARKATEEED